ncbi:polyprenyl synthetase family protein [Paenibacillus methanolicus]|uniref:Geranylgeranyl pyrophosphate synthase n=1 Tax=Paenibacillus methanolicus TaxID=582686 RepID=A0A5S5BPQ4_9BACL|nr:polyprenyl synthetase family protein [Paenibacillus methanolicus]TYP68100.1 geranylgeranyl pyrophosphate synthase [Paenibacillus methanolicus]
MNAITEEFIVDADVCYRQAEQQAARYFAVLEQKARGKAYASALTADIQLWKKNHLRRSWLSRLTGGKAGAGAGGYHRHLQWLKHTGKLDDYLDRSVSYIYMRDLGRAIDQPETKTRIEKLVAKLRERLFPDTTSGQGEQTELFSTEEIYRWGRKEGVEPAVIWMFEKLKNVSVNLPEGLNAEHAQRKLMKIILGVVLHALEEMPDDCPPAERARKLEAAIRLGYSYGLTYPFIDDLLDANVLSAQEKQTFSRMITSALVTGAVPELGVWEGNNKAMVAYVHAELREAFECMERYQRPATRLHFLQQAYVFFHSQEIDRDKALSHAAYTNEELYIPVILKSASSRLVARSVIDAPADEGFESRTFYYGIYNQLADDFADMFDDLKDGAVTPYTYYLTYRDRRPDLINPFELYWTVIAHLLHEVYRSDAKAREVILNRAINGLKRCKARVGVAKYNEIMGIFASGDPAFNRLVQRMVDRADDVDFFDKLLRDQVVANLKNERDTREQFAETVRTARTQINDSLRLAGRDGMPPSGEMLIDAANYSLDGSGKRLRPILTWVMGVQEYGLSADALVPLLRSLEYMHTASLIFDDLPSQDNAPTRRGRSTLHQVHDSATAELTGLLLIQRATQEQASLQGFDPSSVLAMIKYSAQKAEELCMGQAMDLRTKGEALTLEQLNTQCFYKTGLAFEAALVMPAIIAQASEREIEMLKVFAYHAGIAFQIKDDLLDVDGDAALLGKPVGQDAGNNTATFVSILGREGAKKAMWDHYCLALEALRRRERPAAFLKQVLEYMINRDR